MGIVDPRVSHNIVILEKLISALVAVQNTMSDRCYPALCVVCFMWICACLAVIASIAFYSPYSLPIRVTYVALTIIGSLGLIWTCTHLEPSPSEEDTSSDKRGEEQPPPYTDALGFARASSSADLPNYEEIQVAAEFADDACLDPGVMVQEEYALRY